MRRSCVTDAFYVSPPVVLLSVTSDVNAFQCSVRKLQSPKEVKRLNTRNCAFENFTWVRSFTCDYVKGVVDRCSDVTVLQLLPCIFPVLPGPAALGMQNVCVATVHLYILLCLSSEYLRDLSPLLRCAQPLCC